MNLIETFNLQKEVNDFVIQKVKDLLGSDAHPFSFSGHRKDCGSLLPHIPHVTGGYSTVRYGALDYYCGGEQGVTTEGELVIVVKHSSAGSAEFPARRSGYWFIKKA